MATNWICNYAVVQATLPGIENLGYKFWIIWVSTTPLPIRRTKHPLQSDTY